MMNEALPIELRKTMEELGRKGKVKAAAVLGSPAEESALREIFSAAGGVRVQREAGGCDLVLIGAGAGSPGALESAYGARYIAMVGITSGAGAERFRRLAGDRRYLLRAAEGQAGAGYAFFEQVYKDVPESIPYEQGEWRMVLGRVRPGMTVL